MGMYVTYIPCKRRKYHRPNFERLSQGLKTNIEDLFYYEYKRNKDLEDLKFFFRSQNITHIAEDNFKGLTEEQGDVLCIFTNGETAAGMTVKKLAEQLPTKCKYVHLLACHCANSDAIRFASELAKKSKLKIKTACGYVSLQNIRKEPKFTVRKVKAEVKKTFEDVLNKYNFDKSEALLKWGLIEGLRDELAKEFEAKKKEFEAKAKELEAKKKELEADISKFQKVLEDSLEISKYEDAWITFHPNGEVTNTEAIESLKELGL